MKISELLFGIDTGLFVLAWMIQTIVYPTFLYLDKIEFKSWHRIYTRSITRIVFPLMSAQLGVAAFATLKYGEWYWIHSILVALTWLTTIAIFVPKHTSIQDDPTPEKMNSLIQWNWLRTALWTIIFIQSGFYIIF